MSASQTVPTGDRVCSDWPAMAREVGPRFAARASSHDATDSFVADNYRDLRERRAFSAGVPTELGGRWRFTCRALCDGTRAGAALRLDRPGAVDAHAPGRDRGLALAPRGWRDGAASPAGRSARRRSW